MDPQSAIDLCREALKTCLMVGGPILLLSLLLGLLISVFQATTQLHDQTISFVPKILLLLLAIACCLPWLTDRMTEFARDSFSRLPMATGQVLAAPTAAPDRRPLPAQVAALPVVPLKSAPAPDRDPVNGARNSEPRVNPSPAATGERLRPEESRQTSPFQLPHFEFSRTPTADLGG